MTVDVENLHAVTQLKDQNPTVLEYSRNLSNAVYESVKRVTSWGAYYYTSDNSYYPVPQHGLQLKEAPKLGHLCPSAQVRLSVEEKERMRTWANENSKAVRQKTVRQETTKYKAGTLPLNLYQTSNMPQEKVQFVPVGDNDTRQEQADDDHDTQDEFIMDFDPETEKRRT